MPGQRVGNCDCNPQVVQTDEWKISYDSASQVVTLDPMGPKSGQRHHHQFVGDPHDIMDGVQQFDFPAPTCSLGVVQILRRESRPEQPDEQLDRWTWRMQPLSNLPKAMLTKATAIGCYVPTS